MIDLTDAIDEGYQKILIRTVDTDVVVLGIAAAAYSGVRELWLSFGTDTHHRYIPAHEIAASIAPRKSLALPFFHAFTGLPQFTKVVSVGERCMTLVCTCQARKTGDGPILQTGNLFGQIFQRPACHLEN